MAVLDEKLINYASSYDVRHLGLSGALPGFWVSDCALTRLWNLISFTLCRLRSPEETSLLTRPLSPWLLLLAANSIYPHLSSFCVPLSGPLQLTFFLRLAKINSEVAESVRLMEALIPLQRFLAEVLVLFKEACCGLGERVVGFV